MISIVIPTYKNIDLLIANLSENKKHFGSHEIIIVNDDPGASVKNDLKKFDHIILIENGRNLGFAGAVNKGVRAASHEFVMILNSDVILQDTSYEKAIHQFTTHKKLFAVSFAQAEKNGSIVGRNKLFWKNGFMQHSSHPILSEGFNAWAEGGSFMIRKTIFDLLHGFDTLYSPFYWEDVDLSYRAWKSGYEVLFNPRIEVIHHHESTIGKYFAKNRIKKIAYRNQLIFIWKNITEKNLFKTHLAAVPRMLLYSVVHFDWPFIGGILEAIMRLPYIMKNRKEAARQSILTDSDVLSKLNEK